MKAVDFRRFLRRNGRRKNGEPGSLSLRVLVVTDPKMKPRRVEIGLGTSDEAEALARARVMLRAVYALGGKFSSRLLVEGEDGCCATVAGAIPEKARGEGKKLPLFDWGKDGFTPTRGGGKGLKDGV